MNKYLQISSWQRAAGFGKRQNNTQPSQIQQIQYLWGTKSPDLDVELKLFQTDHRYQDEADTKLKIQRKYK